MSEQKYKSKENAISELGQKIFLDRYALKDGSKKSLQEGDEVIVLLDSKTSQREIGTVQSIKDNSATVILQDDTTIDVLREQIDKPIEHTVEEMMDRVAKGASAIERSQVRAKYEKEFRWLLEGWKFVPGGRILSACGTNQELSYYNCFVIPSPDDSRGGIMKSLEYMAEIMSRGGGVGINLSTLRCRYAYVKGVNGRSSGSVSWGGLFSFVTGLIEQGGSRRGALMLILNVWHPDILEFIDAKRTAGKITNANISVNISDDFMKAVEEDSDWELVFPDTSDPLYNAENWHGDIKAWKNLGGKVIVHQTVKAREIWDKIIKSAWASAEPGIWFGDRCMKEANSWYYPEGKLYCTNPCGEQPLPGWGVCNLGHINLSRMYVNGDVDWKTLKKTVTLAVRFLDNVIDITPYFFEQNRKQQKLERRVGLGTIGLAELLIRAKIRYGSSKCEAFIDRLYKFIAVTAYEASSDLAKEKGSFPNFDADKILQSGFMKRMPSEIHNKIREDGLRNITLLTQAPTGTVGTMVGTSTGIEPFYFWSYTRKSRLGSHLEKVSVLEEWEMENPGKELPDYFANALDLTPEEHVRTQAAIQKWVDSAISKTCNVPTEYTVEQTKELYELMYKLGCKGGTIYRDKSRDEQVLNAEPKKPEAKPQPKVRPRPAKRYGVTVTKKTPAGTCHIVMNDDDKGHPFEMFIEIGTSGSDIKAMAEALGRMASILLRINSPVSPEERIEEIIKQLKGIGGQRSVGFGKDRIKSLPDALAQALHENYLAGDSEENSVPGDIESLKPSTNICPHCGNASFVNIEGCSKCYNCGHSEC